MVRPLSVAVALVLAASALAGTVQDLCRIKGQGSSVLRGVGLVVGLNGTGDDAKDLAVALPLMQLLQNNGAGVNTPKDIEKSKAVALVSVTCEVPREGARVDDELDVHVATMNTAKSLKGGRLYLTALQAPGRGGLVYAIAEGDIVIEGAAETHARVSNAARIIRDILMPEVGDSFDLIIDRPFEGWGAATQIAVAVNARAQPGGAGVARAIDSRTVRVTIPETERADRAGFIADVLAAEVTLAQIAGEAKVMYNRRTGAILATADVEIGPVAITHGALSITTATPGQPAGVGGRGRWTGLDTGARAGEKARLTDLLNAFKQLDIPPQEQIGVLQMLHRIGKLQARIEEY